MALIKCPECGKEISDKAVSCPNCGVPIAKASVEKKIPITFSREKAMKLSAVNANVIIDNERVGTLRNGESFVVNISVGSHRIILDSSIKEKNRSFESAMFFGLPMHEGGATGSVTKEIDIPSTCNKVFVQVAPNWKKGILEIESVNM